MKETETLLNPIVEIWRQRFYAKFEYCFLSDKPVDTATAVKFVCLHFGLTRDQAKLLAKYWQNKGFLKIERMGWRILQHQKQEDEVLYDADKD